jgi:archaellum component FlaF (FlaF/FlaG flagellin family)
LSDWKQGNIMALEKVISVDLIEVVENGSVQVRTKTAILEDGKLISSQFHRHVVAPGDDYSGEDARVQAICAATHTAEVVAAYQAAQEAARLPQG